MEDDDTAMGKCSCGSPNKCLEMQKCIIAARDKLRYGSFTIRDRSSDKTASYKEKCTYWLGIPKCIKVIHIRKHHYSSAVLRYLSKEKNYVTTPISQEVVRREGFSEYVQYYLKIHTS